MIKDYTNKVDTLNILIKSIEEEKRDARKLTDKTSWNVLSRELASAIAKYDTYTIVLNNTAMN